MTKPSPRTGERLLLTLDTNQLDDHRIDALRACMDIPHEFACVTVSQRERGRNFGGELQVVPETMVWGEWRWGEAVWGGPIPELWVLGESPLGQAVLATDGHIDVFETALRIISDGSFPRAGEREDMSKGHRRQMRDAMIFEAHVRQRRHVLVTGDRDFTGPMHRDALERLGRTRILAPDELLALAGTGELHTLLLRPT